MIPVRTWQRRIQLGIYWERMHSNFDEEWHRERNKVETALFVIKRRFGEELKARKYWYQVKEIKGKIILHNLTKAVQAARLLLSGEEFNRAAWSELRPLVAEIPIEFDTKKILKLEGIQS